MQSGINIKLGMAIAIIMSFCAFHSSDAAANRRANSVTISNTTANPVPVNVQNQVGTKSADNPDFQPFDTSHSNSTGNSDQLTFSFDVPAGKRLVIEFVTAYASVPPGQNIWFLTVQTTTPDGATAHYIPVVAQGADVGGNSRFSAAQQTKMFAEAGTDHVGVAIARNSSTGSMSAGCSISGHLIDVP